MCIRLRTQHAHERRTNLVLRATHAIYECVTVGKTGSTRQLRQLVARSHAGSDSLRPAGQHRPPTRSRHARRPGAPSRSMWCAVPGVDEHDVEIGGVAELEAAALAKGERASSRAGRGYRSASCAHMIASARSRQASAIAVSSTHTPRGSRAQEIDQLRHYRRACARGTNIRSAWSGSADAAISPHRARRPRRRSTAVDRSAGAARRRETGSPRRSRYRPSGPARDSPARRPARTAARPGRRGPPRRAPAGADRGRATMPGKSLPQARVATRAAMGPFRSDRRPPGIRLVRCSTSEIGRLDHHRTIRSPIGHLDTLAVTNYLRC